MTSMQVRIENKLNEAFSPIHLKVVNDSSKHKGHVGDDGSGESHFSVFIKTAEFNGMNRVQSHKLVYDVLKYELSIIHALSLLVEK